MRIAPHLFLIVVMSGCREPISTPGTSTPTLGDTASTTLVGAADIAYCGGPGAAATARLLESIPGTVFTAGDNAYPDGAATDFVDCYEPTWGRHKDRTRPAAGNHEYDTPGAAPYFEYFGTAAGQPGEGYYSYDLGSWHVIVLNSEIDMSRTSPQLEWLRSDLQASSALCTVAYWHRPRFSSGQHGSEAWLQDAWEILYDAGTEIVISGHDHNYERFAPQKPTGAADPTFGIRQFIVGTGGRGHRAFRTPLPNSEVRHTGTFGVLKLTLEATAYRWDFIPEEEGAFHDSGSGECHAPPGPATQ